MKLERPIKNEDENLQRLRTLIGSYHAGNINNKPLKNELMKISDELLKSGKMSKKEHKTIYDQYIK